MRILSIAALVLALAACGTHGDGAGADGLDDEVRIVSCQDPAECDDGDGCTIDQCVAGRCRNTPLPCDDDNPCTADRCEDGQCVHDAEEGCCTQVEDCDDGDFCTRDECVDGVCVHGEPIPPPHCCDEDADCDDDNDCTKNLCTNKKCDFSKKDPSAGCCERVEDCLDGNYCTADDCVNGRCVNAWDSGCCMRDEDCEDEDPCTAGICDFDTCAYSAVPGCCHEDADCPDVPCTTATCTDHACVRTPIPDCCTRDADCGDPCHVCDMPAGAEAGTCVLKGTPECCTTTVLETPFSALGGFLVSPLPAAGYAATPTWNLDGHRWVSAPTALYFGDPATHRLHPAGDGLVGGRATHAGIDLGTTTQPVLTFQVYRSGSIVPATDVLSVVVVAGTAETVAWSSMDHPVEDGAFRPVSVDLSAFAGRTVSLVLEFDSRSAFATDYEGVWIDDLKVTGQCR